MSGPLDELRKSIIACEEYLFGGEIPCRGMSDILHTIDAFEAAHPGLVDYTAKCPKCGKVYPGMSIDWTWDPDFKGDKDNAPIVCPDHRSTPRLTK